MERPEERVLKLKPEVFRTTCLDFEDGKITTADQNYAIQAKIKVTTNYEMKYIQRIITRSISIADQVSQPS